MTGVLRAVTQQPDVPVPARRFVPKGFDPTDLAALRGLAEHLLRRPIATAADLQAWLADHSELEGQVRAGATRRRIALSRDTSDPAVRQRHLDYEQTVVTEWKRLDDRLSRRYLACACRARLDGRLKIYDRRVETQVALFRDENVDLLAKDAELSADYSTMTGNRTVEFRGETLTAQKVRTFLQDQDRATRADAYAALAAARARDADKTEALFDRMLDLRGKIARNAGHPDYRAYRFLELNRFDYGPGDCLAFHDAVEAVVVPALAARMERRRRLLGIDTLRPYDGEVDPLGREPRRPFTDEAGFVALGRRLFRAIDPRFEEEFDILVRNGLLDLMARPGKAPGGYNSHVADIRLPFVFANAVGNHRDVRTLLHEGGHAFHTLATRAEPILGLASAPIEFCEVASMAMEMFGMERFEVVYAPAQARAAAASLLEQRLQLPVWVATIDAFQHWLYTHPGHTHAERAEQWVALRQRFSPWIDYSGLEDVRATEWHAQLHLFKYPFYYIEYALALLGALQLWNRFRADPGRAVADYRRALALGGTRPLPELFTAAGARFGMDQALLADVFGDLVGELLRLDGED